MKICKEFAERMLREWHDLAAHYTDKDIENPCDIERIITIGKAVKTAHKMYCIAKEMEEEMPAMRGQFEGSVTGSGTIKAAM